MTFLRTVMFLAFVISVPIYVLYLGTLVRFRNKVPFSSPFFTICLVLGVLDLIGLINTWFLTYFPIYGWFGMDHLVKRWPGFWAKVFKTTAFWSGIGGTHSVFIMAFNRMTNIALPLKHQLIWTPNFIKLVIFFQLGLPLIMALPCLTTQFDYVVINGTGALGPTIFLDRKYHVTYYSFAVVHMILANIASLVMYLVLFCKNRANQISPTEQSHVVNQNQNDDLLRKVQKKMVFFGLIMFLLLSLISVYLALLMTTKDPIKLAIYVQLRAVFVDIFTWINPYLALALSDTIRKHFKAFVMCRQVVEQQPEAIRMEPTAGQGFHSNPTLHE